MMGLGDRGDREIIMGSAKQDLSRMEIEIQTLDTGEAIISTIGIRSRSAPASIATRTISKGSTKKRSRRSGTGSRPGSDFSFSG